MKNRQKFDETKDAMAIYEVHPGSWMKHPATEEDEKGFFNYRELAVKLAQYVKDMGYTHVELMGLQSIPLTAPGAIRSLDIMRLLPAMVLHRISNIW